MDSRCPTVHLDTSCVRQRQMSPSCLAASPTPDIGNKHRCLTKKNFQSSSYFHVSLCLVEHCLSTSQRLLTLNQDDDSGNNPPQIIPPTWYMKSTTIIICLEIEILSLHSFSILLILLIMVAGVLEPISADLGEGQWKDTSRQTTIHTFTPMDN